MHIASAASLPAVTHRRVVETIPILPMWQASSWLTVAADLYLSSGVADLILRGLPAE